MNLFCLLRIRILFLLLILQISAYSQSEVVNSIYEKGNIVDGYKSGVWEYYDKGQDELALKIDYDNGSLVYQKPDNSTYTVFLDGKWLETKLDQPPRYIGSMHDFSLVKSKIIYPKKAWYKANVGVCAVVFEVDSMGEAGKFRVLNDIGDGCGEEVLAKLNELPNFWIPAKLKGQNLCSRFIIPVTFRMHYNGRYFGVRRKSADESIPLATELDEFIIEIIGIAKDHKIYTNIRPDEVDITIVKPRYQGGDKALNEYLEANIHPPDETVQGKTYVQFDVDADGYLYDIQILQSLGDAFDKEMKRVINKMPNWIPGTLNGREAKLSMSLSVYFDKGKVRGKQAVELAAPTTGDSK